MIKINSTLNKLGAITLFLFLLSRDISSGISLVELHFFNVKTVLVILKVFIDLLLSFFWFTLSFSFDTTYFISHYGFSSKKIPLKSFNYVHYVGLGFFRCGCVHEKGKWSGPTVLGIYSKKMMEQFLAMLHEQNSSCEIKI
jgi:hypothetical protein